MGTRGCLRTPTGTVVLTSLGSGTWCVRVACDADGTFGAVTRVVDNFGYNAGGWRITSTPGTLADTNGDGCADIVGFGNAGMYVSLFS